MKGLLMKMETILKKGKQQRAKHLKRIDSILKGLIDYKVDKAEYQRIAEKYNKVDARFCAYIGPIG